MQTTGRREPHTRMICCLSGADRGSNQSPSHLKSNRLPVLTTLNDVVLPAAVGHWVVRAQAPQAGPGTPALDVASDARILLTPRDGP
jgi:hypothetical protein